MTDVHQLKAQRQASLDATQSGAPARTTNQFFGVGPITDMTIDEVDARLLQFQFHSWVEQNYPKLDDKGNKIGQFTTAELARGMHRGYPADKVLLDMMREIHRYFGFPKSNKMAVGLGGGHSGFTVCAMHLVNPNNADQLVYVDTPTPETEAGMAGGFFRQSWGAQLLEMQRYAANGDESRILFADGEGSIPSTDSLLAKKVKLFIGVGHETTGATTYTEDEVKNLLAWIDSDPQNHHAVIDGTSMLGAMPWSNDTVEQVMTKCCMFMPFQKAIGGISGYFVISLTPAAVELIDKNQEDPSWPIPRQLKIAVPVDAKKPLSSKITTALGPLYNPEDDKMQGGIINTFSTLAFAETTFGLLRSERRLGNIQQLNELSAKNRKIVNDWVSQNPLFELGVGDIEKRGAAVTLLKVNDPDITDAEIHAKIILRSKQMLGYEGITHTNGCYEKGLDVARYVNAFPGTPGDYRAWIGGVRPHEDISALLDNIEYAYHRAKISVLEDLLAEQGETFPQENDSSELTRQDDPQRAYKILIADLVGMRFDANGNPDFSEVKAHIEAKGGQFHEGSVESAGELEKGKLHFFYQPDLSTEEELLAQTADSQYDALIAAATFFPAQSKFAFGGVRIGAGTGNMGSDSWGGGNGAGGEAPLMNTPSFNSRATAQMAIKALLKVCPDLPVQTMHDLVVAGDFDTGKNLCEYPTEKLEGKKLAVLGYGNIGREVARLAQAFGMSVTIYAREKHQKWIESEGFNYASTIIEAATGADVISPHTGLGAKDATTGKFANQGILNTEVFNALNDGAIVVNYDRGEIIDTDALDSAMHTGKVRYAAIDADLFKNAETGELSGPMLPYLNVVKNHPEKMELLPHAAADTEHLSRVEGAKQAVNQIFDVIQFKVVTNAVGDIPAGYTSNGAKTVKCVGKVTAQDLTGAAFNAQEVASLRQLSEQMAAFWGAIDATMDAARKQELLDRYAAEMILNANTYASQLAALGLQGPVAE
ncbi:NAD(P)-dependent oxidoreductase [Aliikangiella maris]|uniref:NAD(P)-dependent oxidoreductase n=2 Tax=Aliikangiella maris TaxID=3162458 RepID=A0ABV3MKA7_9GAMM